MKKTITFGLVLATLAAFFVVSCANPATGGGVTPPAPDAFPVARDITYAEMKFVGTYSSDTFTISLDGDGTGSYEYSGPAANERKAAGSGKIQWVKGGSDNTVAVKTSKNATADSLTIDDDDGTIEGFITDGNAKIEIPRGTKAVGIKPADLIGTICVIESPKGDKLDEFLEDLVRSSSGTFAWVPTALELLADGKGTANVRIYDSDEAFYKTKGTVTREYEGETYSITWDGNGFGTFSGVPGTWKITGNKFELGGAFVYGGSTAPAYIIGNKAYVWMGSGEEGTREPDLVYVEL